jgi:hypothetical protein
MRHETFELTLYANQDLMDELNELMIYVKRQKLGELQKFSFTFHELDILQAKINTELKKNSRPMRMK